MPEPTLPKQRPSTATDDETGATDDGGTETADQSADGDQARSQASFESLVEQMIQTQMQDLERQLDEVQRQVEEIDDFARISLNERKIKQSEANLTEFSDSLTQFAERAFNNINELEERLDLQALILASIVDALREEGIELEFEEADRYREPNVVTDTQPQHRLEEALDRT